MQRISNICYALVTECKRLLTNSKDIHKIVGTGTNNNNKLIRETKKFRKFVLIKFIQT